jgi:hypothetical protein
LVGSEAAHRNGVIGIFQVKRPSFGKEAFNRLAFSDHNAARMNILQSLFQLLHGKIQVHDYSACTQMRHISSFVYLSSAERYDVG